MNGSAIQLRDTAQNFMINATANDSVDLYFNQNKKFETTNTGAIVTGICTATSFSGSGEGLTRTTQLSHRNMIINGSMMICQRFSVNAANNINNQTHTYHVDRFKAYESTDGILQGEWENDNYSDAGFQYSVKYTPATADTSLSNGQMAFISQVIEMDNMRHLGYGLSYAKTCTLSFYAKASLTGTYAIALINDGTNNRQFVSEFTISNTNWNRHTITIPGDTSGTWNANGLRIAWCLASSTDRHTSTLGSWQSSGTAFYGTSNTVNFMANTSNTFSLTGVQFEIGSSATPYEHRSYGEDLSRCERYFQCMKGPSSTTTGANEATYGIALAYNNNRTLWSFNFKTEMRANPTVSMSNLAHLQGLGVVGGWNAASSFVSANNFSKFGGRVDLNWSGTPYSVGHAVEMRITSNGLLGFDAEL